MNIFNRNEVKWGLAFFIMTLVWMTFEHLMGLHGEKIAMQEKMTGFFSIPAVTVYWLAIRDKRNNDLKGRMTWKQGVIAGLKVTMIATALAPLAMLLTVYVISPDYFKNVIEYTVNVQGRDRAEMEAAFNVKHYLLNELYVTPIMGALTAMVVSAFLKTRKAR